MANIPVRDRRDPLYGVTTVSGPYNPQTATHEQAATATENTFSNDGKTRLWVRNATGSTVTLTFTIPGKCEHEVTHDLTVTVPNGQSGYVGPFDVQRFSEDDGLVHFDSTSTGLQVAAVRH